MIKIYLIKKVQNAVRTFSLEWGPPSTVRAHVRVGKPGGEIVTMGTCASNSVHKVIKNRWCWNMSSGIFSLTMQCGVSCLENHLDDCTIFYHLFHEVDVYTSFLFIAPNHHYG